MQLGAGVPFSNPMSRSSVQWSDSLLGVIHGHQNGQIFHLEPFSLDRHCANTGPRNNRLFVKKSH